MIRTENDRLGNRVAKFGSTEALTLANICSVAAARFKDNAAELRKIAGAGQLADQFEFQATEAAEFAKLFADADHVEIVTTPDDETAPEAAQ